MMDFDSCLSSSQLTLGGSAEAIKLLKTAIIEGKHWYLALLEAIGKWAEAEELHHGRSYCYLIAGEAFDFLLLAERLCEAVNGLLPDEDKTALLFQGRPPLRLTEGKFKELIGSGKFQQYLNYFYGVTVEEALFLAVQDEVRKERWSAGFNNEPDVVSEAYRRVYGATRGVLLKRFRKERGYPHRKSIGLAELREFTYWLFKFRLRQCEKARIASDTKKALNWLSRQNSFPGGLIA
jgi:hypothetical protein